jgi:hypothetical protein
METEGWGIGGYKCEIVEMGWGIQGKLTEEDWEYWES